MTYLYGISLFLIGFLIGAGIIWYIRQKEIDIAQSSRNQLKAEFGIFQNRLWIRTWIHF